MCAEYGKIHCANTKEAVSKEIKEVIVGLKYM